MKIGCHPRRLALILLVSLTSGALSAQKPEPPFEPKVGQAGKDVIWVPTPPALVEKMMDLAKVTPQDYVIDLGSGDGRNVIAAAKRGARALGVEYNPQMVELSRRNAEAAGVGGRAKFVRGDMYKADISKATVLALFLLPSNMFQLRDKFFALRPGSRIVSNTFYIQDWGADRTETIEDCNEWCTAVLWIVPAKVQGTWRSELAHRSATGAKVGRGELVLKQSFQMLSGTLNGAAIAEGRLRGEEIVFTAADVRYSGRVRGDTIEGTATSSGGETKWRATRARR